MKHFFSIILGVVVTVGLVAAVFALKQAQEEQDSFTADLQSRTAVLTDSFKESLESLYLNNSTNTLQQVVDKFANRGQLAGLAVYDRTGKTVAASSVLAGSVVSNPTVVLSAISSDKPSDGFIKDGGKNLYMFAEPLHQGSKVAGVLMVVQNVNSINSSFNQIWQNNLFRLLIQILLFSLIIVLILRWVIFKPLFGLIQSARLLRSGRIRQTPGLLKGAGFLTPLANEISKMSQSLFKARSAASEEARLRLAKLDAPWTAERLQEFIKAYLKDRPIFVVSNREPFTHKKVKSEIQYFVPPSGMVTAMESVMEACGGMWLAHGSGDADKETADQDGKIQVPPDEPKYILKRIWLTEKEQAGFYSGFSNEALWPLCHMAHTRPIFRQEDWQEYRRVNGKFAQALLAEIKDVQRPLVLAQDFHFALLPQMVKKSRPDAQVGLFWHIPWPSAESFSVCPWRKEILLGMLGADVLGFHTQQYCNNFMETVSKEIESLTDLEQFSITHDGHLTYIKPFPISIDFTSDGNKEPDETEKSVLLEQLGIKTKYLGLGVDRMDYTKGLLERFKGIEFFFDLFPAYKEQFTFLQIAAPSREGVEKYREFSEEVTAEAERINQKLQTNDWRPIVLLKEYHPHQEIYPLYRQANVCLVTSLHDGMNLVAKEFVAARNDEAGVLVLSQFAGASRDLKEALVINPYSAEKTAEAIHTALTMSLAEQHRRMKKMRDSVKNYNVYRWSAELIKAITSLA